MGERNVSPSLALVHSIYMSGAAPRRFDGSVLGRLSSQVRKPPSGAWTSRIQYIGCSVYWLSSTGVADLSFNQFPATIATAFFLTDV